MEIWINKRYHLSSLIVMVINMSIAFKLKFVCLEVWIVPAPFKVYTQGSNNID